MAYEGLWDLWSEECQWPARLARLAPSASFIVGLACVQHALPVYHEWTRSTVGDDPLQVLTVVNTLWREDQRSREQFDRGLEVLRGAVDAWGDPDSVPASVDYLLEALEHLLQGHPVGMTMRAAVAGVAQPSVETLLRDRTVTGQVAVVMETWAGVAISNLIWQEVIVDRAEHGHVPQNPDHLPAEPAKNMADTIRAVRAAALKQARMAMSIQSQAELATILYYEALLSQEAGDIPRAEVLLREAVLAADRYGDSGGAARKARSQLQRM